MLIAKTANCQVLTAEFFHLEQHDGVRVLRLQSDDGTNRLTRACVLALTEGFRDMARKSEPLIVTGNRRFFSAGADLREIALQTGPEAYEFSRYGSGIDEYRRSIFLRRCTPRFPGTAWAVDSIWLWLVTGESLRRTLFLDIAVRRSGLITGWGGTQRLPRLVGKAKALEMFVAAEKLHA